MRWEDSTDARLGLLKALQPEPVSQWLQSVTDDLKGAAAGDLVKIGVGIGASADSCPLANYLGQWFSESEVFDDSIVTVAHLNDDSQIVVRYHPEWWTLAFTSLIDAFWYLEVVTAAEASVVLDTVLNDPSIRQQIEEVTIRDEQTGHVFLHTAAAELFTSSVRPIILNALIDRFGPADRKAELSAAAVG